MLLAEGTKAIILRKLSGVGNGGMPGLLKKRYDYWRKTTRKGHNAARYMPSAILKEPLVIRPKPNRDKAEVDEDMFYLMLLAEMHGFIGLAHPGLHPYGKCDLKKGDGDADAHSDQRRDARHRSKENVAKKRVHAKAQRTRR